MTYNVQLSVIVRGSGFWSGNMEFVKVEDGREVHYTPLGGSSDAPLFILTDNGVYRIYCNGFIYRTITIEGMVMPEQPYSKIDCGMNTSGNIALTTRTNVMQTSERCLNYPFKPTDERPFFMIELVLTDLDYLSWSNVQRENIRISQNRTQSNLLLASFQPIKAAEPVIMRIDGVIVFVGNYEQQRRRRR